MFHILDQLLANGCSAVAEGNFTKPEPFRALPDARIVEVHVTAPADVLHARYRTRAGRHPVHYDLEVVDELPARNAEGEWDPLHLGETIVVDTTAPVDVASLARRVRA